MPEVSIKPYEEQYLTFEALESGTFSFVMTGSLSTGYLKSISYSLDNGKTWNTTTRTSNDAITITTPSVSAGDKVLWKGSGDRVSFASSIYSTFVATGLFVVYGNIYSLLLGDNFVGVTYPMNAYMFERLFAGNTYLTSAEHLILPSPTVVNRCYLRMFNECTALEIAPVLPAQTLAQYCYSNLFNGCSSLRYIKCLAIDKSATSCVNTWVGGVAAIGTFVKDANATWSTGSSGIPSGWTVEDA